MRLTRYSGDLSTVDFVDLLVEERDFAHYPRVVSRAAYARVRAVPVPMEYELYFHG